MTLLAVEVFTPNEFPLHTYVNRQDARLEERLRNALRTPKAVVSISGPSKSGKTVLVERLVGRDNLISVSGAEIQSATDLWDRVLDWMGSPTSVASQDQTGENSSLSGQISGGLYIPLFTKAGAKATYGSGASTTMSTTITRARGGLPQVVREIASSDFVVLIDDFHYMPRSLQADAARQVKTAAERGVRICVASVPHRADDVVRSNPELRGRTTNLDTSFWSASELAEIARLGFDRLNLYVDPSIAKRLAEEACGSPQLMQAICLQACYKLGIRSAAEVRNYPKISNVLIEAILEETSLQSDYSSLIDDMHQGPKTRGTERREFEFIDGSKGDVYRAILLAISQSPPITSLPYPELMQRVKGVCVNGAPGGSSVTESCKQIANFALAKYPDQRIVEFDSEGGSDTLSIVDPYLLFYIRSSPKIGLLGRNKIEAGREQGEAHLTHS